jgi:hypothetical protein
VSVPKRIRAQRTKGWRLPPNTVIVNRTSRYGNPWAVREVAPVDGERRWLIELVKPTLLVVDPQPDLRMAFQWTSPASALEAAVGLFVEHQLPHLDLGPLRGMDVACSCDPASGLPCHGDPILEAANRPARDIATIAGVEYEVVLWGCDCDADGCGGVVTPDTSRCHDCGREATRLYTIRRPA